MPGSLTIASDGNPRVTFLTMVFCLMANALWYQDLIIGQSSLLFYFSLTQTLVIHNYLFSFRVRKRWVRSHMSFEQWVRKLFSPILSQPH